MAQATRMYFDHRYEPSGCTLSAGVFQVVMAQATHMYFDHPYEPDPEERGLYWAPRFTHTRKAFSFMPSDLYANADVARSGDPVQFDDLCGDDGEDCVELKKPENIAGQ